MKRAFLTVTFLCLLVLSADDAQAQGYYGTDTGVELSCIRNSMTRMPTCK